MAERFYLLAKVAPEEAAPLIRTSTDLHRILKKVSGKIDADREEAERLRDRQYCDAEAAAKIFARACGGCGLGDPVIFG